MIPRFPVAVHVFLLREGRVLLARRSNTGYEDDRLGVVAGHVERGESATQAAARETCEEAGLALPSERFRVVGVMHRSSEEGRVDFFFACDLDDEEPVNREPHKCSELVWAEPHALPHDTIGYVREAPSNFAAGRWFAEHGWDVDSARPPGDPAATTVIRG